MRTLLLLILVGFIIIGCGKKENSSRLYLAKVNDTVITEADFIGELSHIPEWARSNFSGKEGKERFLQEMIDKEMIYQDAVRKGLVNNRELSEKVEEFRKMTLLAFILKQEIEDKATVTESEIKEHYETNIDHYRKEGSQMEFSEAKGLIENQLLKKKQKDLFDSYLKSLKEKSDVKTDESALTSVKLPWEKTE